MFNLQAYIDLPTIWGILISVAVLMYAILDGFDLGVGILFPFAPSESCRDKLMNSIAPFWDGNETWLILGGGGLFAAFPLAYAILMQALYLPVLFMLMALIFRGVAFEFRFKTESKYKMIWDASFHFGSLFAAFMQGVILGNIVHGIKVDDLTYTGNPFDWIHGFSIVTGIAIVVSYALLGATWTMMKTVSTTKNWALKCARYLFVHVMFFALIGSIWTGFLNEKIYNFWFTVPNFYILGIIPFLCLLVSYHLLKSLIKGDEYKPFILTICLFVLGFIGFGLSVWPYIIPHSVTWAEAAAAPESQSLMLVGALLILPIILFYVGYTYYVFRGKSTDEKMY